MITFRQKGDFSKLDKFLNNLRKPFNTAILEHYAQEGVQALSSATPKDTGLTADSWYYEITENNGSVTISFNNSNVNKGVPIALVLQYGHGTRNGGYVEGIDYINPAMRPIFEKLADQAWKEVTMRIL